MQQAVLIGYLRVNPTDACTLPRVIKKEMHPLEEDQVAAFLKEVQGSPHEYLYKIALFTGLREGEILGLGWEHIDLENGILTVKRQLRKEQKKGGQYYFSPPKNNRARSISLAPSVVLLFRLQNWSKTVCGWRPATHGRRMVLSSPIKPAAIYPIARCMTASSAL